MQNLTHADDLERNLASFAAAIASAQSFEVLVEHGPKSALAPARSAPPEVCVLDIGLPDIDGHELARQLRAQAATAHCMLIAVTGYGHAQDRQRALAAGFDHHLVKPVNAATLLELIAVGGHQTDRHAGIS